MPLLRSPDSIHSNTVFYSKLQRIEVEVKKQHQSWFDTDIMREKGEGDGKKGEISDRRFR